MASALPKKTSSRLPPQNVDAERSVLGILLIDKNAIHTIADILAPQDFYSPAHEKIYESIFELYEKHQPVDLLTLTSRLKEKGVLQGIGGSSYLAELTNDVVTSAHLEHYAKLVKEKRVLRDLIKASAEIAENAFDSTGEFEELLDNVEGKILAISQKSLPQRFAHIRDELKTAYDRVEKLNAKENALRGVGTGFPALDNILSGLQKSDLIVVGARPSFGKTTFALDIARHAALQGTTVGTFSLEMSREQVIDRLIAAESGVPLWKLRTGHMITDEEFGLIQHSLDTLSHAPFFIDDTPSPNILHMRSMARRLQIEYGLGLLVVDYLQLIAPRHNTQNMVQQVTEISRGLKAIARELNVPLIAISQLSRAVDQRDNRIPRLSDLRESGSIEQDADVVLLLYRKEGDRTDSAAQESNIVHVSIAKHRNGPLGGIELLFDSERVTFRSVDKRHTEYGETAGIHQATY